MTTGHDAVLKIVEGMRDEIADWAAALIRVPTVNPPGLEYPAIADLVGERLRGHGMTVEHPPVPDEGVSHPRVNTVGTLEGDGAGPCVHFNGHVDVVPAGEGWSVDPFGGVVRDGRLVGRGAADMKGGLACAMFAVEAIRRAGVGFPGRLEVSATVDEESGGFLGMAHLAETGVISSARTDHVIIPEPFGVEQICLGHRGVYWFRVTTHGKIAHGSMPFLGLNAVDRMREFLDAVDRELRPALQERVTRMPVVPDGARRATLNLNTVEGGQAGDEFQTPCVPDRCVATFDRRFIPEEQFADVTAEIRAIAAGCSTPESPIEVEDLMSVQPTFTPESDPLVTALRRAVSDVTGRPARCVASPGTYDHKHVTKIGGVTSCVAYGPGLLEQAHQPDEWCALDDMVTATSVMACTAMELLGVSRV